MICSRGKFKFKFHGLLTGEISARVVRLRLVISSKKELRTRERKKNSAKDTASVAIQRIFRGWCAAQRKHFRAQPLLSI